jgi:pSer/pThr/pTyr-binding forkhead associated (FHA) protein
MSTCPYCGAETRPGDNFCLSCGHRLGGVAAPAQAAPAEPTIPAQGDWMPPSAPYSPIYSEATVAAAPAAPAWAEPNGAAAPAGLDATVRTGGGGATTVPSEIEKPAILILRADNGETVQEYVLDRTETVIGRGANSHIVLSKDKLTSRRHAIVRYENGSYVLRDGGSSNGTFINGQQLDKNDARVLQDGDHIGIGEYELIFRSSADAPAMNDVADLPTMQVPMNVVSEMTYGTREDEHATAATGDEYGTKAWDGAATAPEIPPEPAAPPVIPPPMPVAEVIAPVSVPAAVSVPDVDASSSAIAAAKAPDSDVNFSRLTSIPLPALPDIAPIVAALAALDGQVTALQEQLSATHDGLREHEEEIVKTTKQLRAGVRNVAERMNTTIADVARAREALAWAELRQLMEDVMNNPRDIEYVTKLARRSRELNKVFLMHQDVLNTMAECYSLLRGLITE